MISTITERELERYPNLDQEIEQAWREFEKQLEKQETAESMILKAQSYSGMPHSSEVGNPVLAVVLRMVDDISVHLEFYRDRYNYLIKLKRDIEEGMDNLDSIERRIVDLMCFKGERAEIIGRKVGYSRSQVYVKMNEALEKF